MSDAQERKSQYYTSFGPFRLTPAEGLLERDGEIVSIGSRALALLIVLVRNAQKVVSKSALMAHVWPDLSVDEGSLRSQMNALRKALSDGRDGARYITTHPGRGYCFVAAPPSADPQSPLIRKESSKDNLPYALDRMIGRSDDIAEISSRIVSERFVSIVGSGGIGKTTVAVATGHALSTAFDGAVRLIELGPIGDPRLVASAVATNLGLTVNTEEPVASIVASLRDQRILLILDSCEHVIETAARFVEAIYAQVPEAYLLVTSRETLRVEGEHVHWLRPLALPSDGNPVTADDALEFPAVQLFVERLSATAGSFELTNFDAKIVVDICRRLDGIALAIELAASRAATYGIAVTARLLERQFHLHWQGRRTAIPRHQTLAAALDWSYLLLSEQDRRGLWRLSTFAGTFDLAAATALIVDDDIDEHAALDIVASLVGKSLVATASGEPAKLYRLLDTTREYALNKLRASGCAPDAKRRHATYLLNALVLNDPEGGDLTQNEAFAHYGGYTGDARLALEWSFGKEGDHEIGIALAAATAPVFLILALLNECNTWVQQAIDLLPDDAIGSRVEMQLQAALGQSLMWTEGRTDRLLAANERALEIAELMEGPQYRLWLIRGLHSLFQRIGDYRQALVYAERCRTLSEDLGDEARLLAASLLGISRHSMGINDQALVDLRTALAVPPKQGDPKPIYFALDYRNRARLALARSLWVSGFADQAVEVSGHALAEAIELHHPVAVCMSHGWTAALYLWVQDVERAELHIDTFWDMIQRHSFAGGEVNMLGVKAVLSMQSGMVEENIEQLQSCVADLQREQYQFFLPNFEIALVQALTRTERSDEALTVIDRALLRAEQCGDLLTKPEMLRAKGEVLLGLQRPRWAEGEAILLQALDLARAQGSLAWELRAAMSLCRHRRFALEDEAAPLVLSSVFARFSEGFDTSDLIEARHLLESLD